MFHSIKAIIRLLIPPNIKTVDNLPERFMSDTKARDSFLETLDKIARATDHQRYDIDGDSITCQRCGAVSYHPDNIANRWCGVCEDRNPRLTLNDCLRCENQQCVEERGPYIGKCTICSAYRYIGPEAEPNI